MKTIIFIISVLFLSAGLYAEEPQKNSAQSSTGAEAEKSDAERAKVEQEIQNRVKELIELINQEPNLLMVNPKAQVVKDANRQPVTPDGKKNQDFRVVPDDSSPEIAQVLQIEQKREQWAKELVTIGLPAVQELVKAVLDSGRKYRKFYVWALGQIKDVKATPAILKYYKEGVDQENLAKSLEKMGVSDESQRLRQESAEKKSVSIDALKNITGQDYGDEYQKWEQWWKETEKKIGPVELPKPYEIKGGKKSSGALNPATGSTVR